MVKVKNTIDSYTYRIEWSDEDGEWVGSVLEFHGLSWLDESPVQALNGIQQVTQECVEDMIKQGEEPPEPFSERNYSGKFMVRVTPYTHRMLSEEAAEQVVSLNRIASQELAKPLVGVR